MEITLIDKDQTMCREWHTVFAKERNVSIAHADVADFDLLPYFDGIVSPANSYGLMDGGYDLALSEIYGPLLEKEVQKVILRDDQGEQPVATSIVVKIPDFDQYLIHTPTMRIPSRIADPFVIYQAMRSTLLAARKHHLERILIPAFGHSTGGITARKVAKLMYLGYHQVMNPPEKIDWKYPYSYLPESERQ